MMPVQAIASKDTFHFQKRQPFTAVYDRRALEMTGAQV